MAGLFLGGCAHNLTGYYKKLRTKLDAGDYGEAAKFVDKSESTYGKKNVLMYHLDSGIVNHFASNYETSLKSFEQAKKMFAQYYQKSITAGVASMFFNDNTLPYYGKDFERVHMHVFEALDYILSGQNDEAVVEARQVDTLFKTLQIEKNYKIFYKDDGFIRYLMGFVYENAKDINDAHISYYKALKAYKNGIAEIAVPKKLIDDAYTSALLLGMEDRAYEIKKEYPQACKCMIPSGCGECVVINYNGIVPEKIETVLEFALSDAWAYVGIAEVGSGDERSFAQAKSIGISAFANDYIKVSFPKYRDFKNKIVSFSITNGDLEIKSNLVQDLSNVAKKCLDADITKIYAKTLARAAVKYVIGKSCSQAIEKEGNKALGLLSKIAFNAYNSLSEVSDKRAWHTLPDKVLMARFYLPEGLHTLKVNFLGSDGEILQSKDVSVDVKAGKKNFITIRSSKIY
jgi:hypothetical protein